MIFQRRWLWMVQGTGGEGGAELAGWSMLLNNIYCSVLRLEQIGWIFYCIRTWGLGNGKRGNQWRLSRPLIPALLRLPTTHHFLPFFSLGHFYRMDERKKKKKKKIRSKMARRWRSFEIGGICLFGIGARELPVVSKGDWRGLGRRWSGVGWNKRKGLVYLDR